jgi:hypothetical protein
LKVDKQPKIPLLELLINCQKRMDGFLAVDQKLKITQNDINKTFDQLKTCEII